MITQDYCNTILGSHMASDDELKSRLVNDTSGTYKFIGIVYPYNDPNNEKETASTYDWAMTSIWPVLITHCYSNGIDNHTFSDFKCIRADQLSPGSRAPRSFGNRADTSAATSIYLSGWFSAAVTAVAAAILLS
jgi:hypothetical protein